MKLLFTFVSFFTVAISSQTAIAVQDSVIATCIPKDFDDDVSSTFAQLKKDDSGKYSISILKYQGRRNPLASVAPKIPVKISSADNGFELKANAFRIDIVSMNLSRRVTFDANSVGEETSTYSTNIFYSRLRDKINRRNLFGDPGFSARFRYLTLAVSINSEVWCHAHDLKTLLEDSEQKK